MGVEDGVEGEACQGSGALGPQWGFQSPSGPMSSQTWGEDRLPSGWGLVFQTLALCWGAHP